MTVARVNVNNLVRPCRGIVVADNRVAVCTCTKRDTMTSDEKTRSRDNRIDSYKTLYVVFQVRKRNTLSSSRELFKRIFTFLILIDTVEFNVYIVFEHD